MQSSSSEKVDLGEKSVEEREYGVTPLTIKLDETGLPLIPQPSTSEDDPLNYPNVRLFS